MARAVQVNGAVWAIDAAGSVRRTAPAHAAWLPVPSAPPAARALAAAPSLLRVLAAGADGSVRAFDAESAELVASAEALHSPVTALLALDREGALFVATADGAIVRMDLESLEFLAMLGEGGVEHRGAVHALVADDQFLYSGGADASVLVWNFDNNSCEREISMPSGPVRSLLRVDLVLWVGQESGLVEVLDIYGDDTNGIECIARASPHSRPVSTLLRVGQSEVWSAAEPVLLSGDGEQCAGHDVAIWDVRDMAVCDHIEATEKDDVFAMIIAGRSAYEDVRVLSLSKSLGVREFSKTVAGCFRAGQFFEDSEVEEDLLDAVTDLEDQLDKANDEIHLLRSKERFYGIDSLAQTSVVRPLGLANSVNTMAAAPIDRPSVNGKGGSLLGISSGTSVERDVLNGQSPSVSLENVTSPRLSASVTDALSISLRRASELLSTLLADSIADSDPRDVSRKYNHETQSAIARVTKEIAVGIELINTCREENMEMAPYDTKKGDDPSIDEENLTTLKNELKSVQVRLETETEKRRVLEKDLSVVCTERNLLATDLEELQAESNLTMESLEQVIRGQDDKLTASKERCVELVQSQHAMELQYEAEKARRGELESMLGEQVSQLNAIAANVGPEFTDQLEIAYQRLDTDAVELEALQARVKSLEVQLEDRTATVQQLSDDRDSLQSSLSILREQSSKRDMDEATSAKLRLDSAKAEARSKAQENLKLQCEKDVLEQEMARRRTETIAEKEELQSTLDALQEQMRAQRLEITGLLSVEKELEEEKALGAAAAAQSAELQIALATAREQEENSRQDVLQLQIDKEELEEEIAHRLTAAEYQNAEVAAMKSAISKLRAALSEIQDALDSSEAEVADLLDKLNESEKCATEAKARIAESQLKTKEMELASEHRASTLEGELKAAHSLLASAQGEIAQLSKEIDSLHRTNRARESELIELREAILVRDESISDRAKLLEVLISERDELMALHRNARNDAVEPNTESAKSARDDLELRNALDVACKGMAVTQEKLRELSHTARSYKQVADSHAESLPALIELEAELQRLAGRNRGVAKDLIPALGVVQSIIAVYFSPEEKLNNALGEDMRYISSPMRFDALQSVIATLRSTRGQSPRLPTDSSSGQANQENQENGPNITNTPVADVMSLSPVDARESSWTPRRFLNF